MNENRNIFQMLFYNLQKNINEQYLHKQIFFQYVSELLVFLKSKIVLRVVSVVDIVLSNLSLKNFQIMTLNYKGMPEAWIFSWNIILNFLQEMQKEFFSKFSIHLFYAKNNYAACFKMFCFFITTLKAIPFLNMVPFDE